MYGDVGIWAHPTVILASLSCGFTRHIVNCSKGRIISSLNSQRRQKNPVFSLAFNKRREFYSSYSNDLYLTSSPKHNLSTITNLALK